MILFDNESTSAAFWFAAEEYILKVLRPDEPVLMLWNTDDTIMIGANQIAEAECDTTYARSSEIEVVRRSSGGGAIFTDRGTLQYTVILPCVEGDDPALTVRAWLAEPIIAALGRYGVSASLEGRNDVVIEGKKISGMAQYIREGYVCSHCSLLFSTDLEKLTRSLSVDREKFKTKAIASTRARVANISDHIDEKDLQSFRNALITSATQKVSSRAGFSEAESAAIAEIMREKYLNPEWTYGREPAFTFTNAKRFPGGRIEAFLDVKGGIIKEARISGDFLSLLPVAELEEKLKGVPHRADALTETLKTIDVQACLGSLGAPELLEVLL